MRNNMADHESDLVFSGLSRMFTQGGITVDLKIYRRRNRPREWRLEVVNSSGTSIIWDDTFTSDDNALMAFIAIVEDQGMVAFREGGPVVVSSATNH
jgi:uncharacterized protein